MCPDGSGAYRVGEGIWGFTEDDGTPHGRTPPAIRRACILMLLRMLPLMGSDDATDVKNAWRIIEERTRDQSYKLDPAAASTATLTGDPEVDALLEPYVRPSPIGAA